MAKTKPMDVTNLLIAWAAYSFFSTSMKVLKNYFQWEQFAWFKNTLEHQNCALLEVTQAVNEGRNLVKQECIPAGCVPTASVADIGLAVGGLDQKVIQDGHSQLEGRTRRPHKKAIT